MNNVIKSKLDILYSKYILLKKNIFELDLNKKNIDLYKNIKNIKNICSMLVNLNIVESEINYLNKLKHDKEFSDIANEELEIQYKKKEVLNLKIKNILINDDQDSCIIEIRAGTGGHEACLFVKDLFNLYIKYANLNSWNSEILNLSIDHEGYKYILIKFSGKLVFTKLQFESGCHRVQRVPTTDNQGRVHTSTCTVAVLSNISFNKLPSLNMNDIRIDTYRSSGAGGQHVNTTDSAVRIKHLPTGLVVECQDERSQHKNKNKALEVLKIKLRNYEESKIKLDINLKKKCLLGTGERSFKNRTYNFIKDRITDHRINISLSLSQVFMSGNLTSIIDILLEKQMILFIEKYIILLEKLI